VINLISGYSVIKDLSEVESDALGVLLFKGEELPEELEGLDKVLDGSLRSLLEAEEFRGEEGKSVVIYALSKPFKRIIAVGGGELKGVSEEVLRVYAASVIQKAKELGIRKVALWVRAPGGLRVGDALRAVAEGASLANYVWGRKKDLRRVEGVELVGRDEIKESEGILKEVEVIREAIYFGRDLANSPASEVSPEGFEGIVRKAFKDLPVTIKVLHKDELVRKGLNGVVAVGKGSEIPPRLLIVEYRGGDEEMPWVAIVGKGVCFDAGGLDLKTASGMLDMKFDKSGAAYAVSVAYAAAKLGLKVNLVVLAPLVENLPSGKSYKPLDIIRMYNGLTVEVHNTDAEGRLILADALAYASRNYRPSVIIDLATLTGSVIVALGNHAAGLFTNDEGLKQSLMRASEKTGERLWPFPMWREYYEDIKSDFADIKNLGVARSAGAIIGGVFLSKFVDEGIRWAPIDIAGVANTQEEGPKKPYYVKGATGFGIRLIIQYLRELAEGS